MLELLSCCHLRRQEFSVHGEALLLRFLQEVDEKLPLSSQGEDMPFVFLIRAQLDLCHCPWESVHEFRFSDQKACLAGRDPRTVMPFTAAGFSVLRLEVLVVFIESDLDGVPSCPM